MSSNISRRISDPMFEILCRRVSIHDIFNDNEENIVIDETDEDEVLPLLTYQTFKAIIDVPMLIDESDEEVDEVSRIVVDDTDEDDVSHIVIDENHKDVGDNKVSHKECLENKPFKGKTLCPKLMLFRLTNKLEMIVSKIEKLELISCDLESGITTDFDNCVMLRLQAVEVS